MNRAKPQYSFPELKGNEILQCMADLRIPLSDQDLQKPSPQTVQRVYEAFVEIFMGPQALSVVSSLEPGLSGNNGLASDSPSAVAASVQALEHPEIHIPSLHLLAFYKQVARLMFQVGIDDFSLKDVVKPEPQRLRLLLSAIINFAKFREEQLSVWEELVGKGEEVQEEHKRLVNREDDLSAKIEAIREQRRQEEPQVNRTKEQIGGMVSELRELKRQQTALSADIDNLKSSRQSLSDNQARLQYLLSSGRQDCAKLKSRIVHSPEKLLQILSEMQANIAGEKAALQSLEKRSRELSVRQALLGNLEEGVSRSLSQLEHNNQLQAKQEELRIQLQQLTLKRESQHVQLEEMAVRQNHLQRQLQMAAEKLARLTSQQSMKRDEFAGRLAQLRTEYGVLSEERAKLTMKMDDTDRLVKDMEQKVQVWFSHPLIITQ